MAAASEAQREAELRRLDQHFEDKPEGPVSAAIIAGGIGAFALGLLTTLAEANETIKGWLELKASVGPLSGKTTLAVLAWLVAWGILHGVLRSIRHETRRAFTIALILIALGVIGTFPTFFQAFAAE
jgi:fluoride ion exporter CrcB/FEX